MSSLRPTKSSCVLLVACLTIMISCGDSRRDPAQPDTVGLIATPSYETNETNQIPTDRSHEGEKINCACADAMTSFADTLIANTKNAPTTDQHAKGDWGDAYCVPASAFIMLKWMKTMFNLDLLVDDDAVKTITALARRMITGSSSGTSPLNVLKGLAKFLILDKEQNPGHWQIIAYDERGKGNGTFQQNGINITVNKAADYATIRNLHLDSRSIVMVWQQMNDRQHHVMVVDAMSDTAADGKYTIRVSDPNINGKKTFRVDASGHLFDADGNEYVDRMWVVLKYVGP